jgi:DNA polymerase-4/protein ImuB
VLEDADLGIAYLDLKGLEALYRGNAGVIRAVLGALPAAYRPRVGIAGGKFIAYVAALQAEPGSAYHAPADAAAFLSGLSVLRLPGPWEMRARLWDFGLRTIGSVARIPFDAMQGEFGAEGARLWHLANGQDPEHLLPRSHETRIHVETSFPAPSASLPVIFVALESLLVKVFGGIRGQYARAAVLEGRIAGRPPWVKRCVFKEAVGDANQALPLLRDRLGQLTLPGPLDGLSLTLSDFTGEPGRQESLFLDVRRHADMDEAIRQLRVRMGYSPMYQIREMEPWSRIPERRHALVPYEP